MANYLGVKLKKLSLNRMIILNFTSTSLKNYCATMNIPELLAELEQKARKMKARSERLEKENEELRASVFNYLKKLDEQRLEQEEANKRFQAAVAGNTLNGDRKILQKELDRYIHLIDQCLASLNAGLIGK